MSESSATPQRIRIRSYDYIELDHSIDSYRYYHLKRIFKLISKIKQSFDTDRSIDSSNYTLISTLNPDEITDERIRDNYNSLAKRINFFIASVLLIDITDMRKLELIEIGNAMLTPSEEIIHNSTDQLQTVCCFINNMISKTRKIVTEIDNMCNNIGTALRDLISNYTNNSITIDEHLVDRILFRYRIRMHEYEPVIDGYTQVLWLFLFTAVIPATDQIYFIETDISKLQELIQRFMFYRSVPSSYKRSKLYIKRSVYDSSMSKLDLIDQYCDSFDIICENAYNRAQDMEHQFLRDAYVEYAEDVYVNREEDEEESG